MRLNRITVNRIIVGAITLAFLFLCAYLISPYNEGISSTLNGFLTLIDIGLVYITASSESKSAKYQKESIMELRKKNTSDQARKVYSHMIEKSLKPLYSQDKLFPIFQPVMIGNSSDAPVYKVFVVSRSNEADFKSMKERYKFRKKSFKQSDDNSNKLLKALPSKMKDEFRFSKIRLHHLYVYLQVLPPEMIYKVIPYAGSSAGGKRPAAMIFFTDSNGKKWTRDPQGNLILLPSNFNVCRFCDLDATDIRMCPSPEMSKNYTSLDDLYKKYNN